MNAMKSLREAVIRTAVIWGLVFSAVPPGGAQEKTKAQEAAKKTDAAPQLSATQAQTVKTVELSAPATDKSSGGQHEGIKVHGYWTITIRKEDGSVASHHEFENALVNPLQLLRLLARETSMGRWEVEVGGTPQPCGLTTTTAGACSLDETTGTPTFGTLQVSRPTSGPDAGALVLTGSTQARRASQIQQVRTRLMPCLVPGPPSMSCSFNSFDVLTEKDVTALNIAVQANQTIDVTVAINFVN
jgi:hypothetical protein